MANNNLQFNFCYQRSRQQSFAIAPYRTELQQTPYTIDPNTNKLMYSQKQLDMRRKAEILKYKPNMQTTQTNNLTKKQTYSLMSNGSFSRTKYTGTGNTIINTISCTNDKLIPTPTSSCDVPGPIQYLIYDETVPLYNYTMKDQVFNLVDAVNIPSFSISNLSNQAFYYSSPVSTNITISSIYFRGIINDTKNININIPLGITLQGNIITGDINANTLPSTANIIFINNVSFDVNIFYGNVLIDTSPTITMNSKPLSIINTFDLSFSIPQVSSGKQFNSTNYIGNMNIQNLSVFVGSGSIYDIEITVKSYELSVYNLVNLNSIYFIGNYTNTDTSNNCIISANPITDTYSAISINIT